MKVALVSSFDRRGGAGIAASRLHRGLREVGVDSRMIVQFRESEDPSIVSSDNRLVRLYDTIGDAIDRFPLLAYPRRSHTPFGLRWLPGFGPGRIEDCGPEIVNLHAVRGGYVRLGALARLKRPLVWTMHDKWCFSGGCHFSGTCTAYVGRCGSCPVLGGKRSWDLSRWVWQRKRKLYSRVPIRFLAPSKWLAAEARQSSLLREAQIDVIPNGIDLALYSPVEKPLAREMLELNRHSPVILFGAESAALDDRKGHQHLSPMLHYLDELDPGRTPTLLVFGSSSLENLREFPCPVRCLGRLKDDLSLRVAYSAADVFVCPSMEDNLPNTVVEAMACGAPTVAFSIGGLPELVTPGETGYLARAFDTEDLARGVQEVLATPRYAAEARRKAVREFDFRLQARRYSALFQELVSNSHCD